MGVENALMQDFSKDIPIFVAQKKFLPKRAAVAF